MKFIFYLFRKITEISASRLFRNNDPDKILLRNWFDISAYDQLLDSRPKDVTFGCCAIILNTKRT